ncbi:MAG: sigma-70 family RNA polymerase sigma factor [Deltaproteobacteria bacterium]|nr:sigma-70 family RNA polymerase sigma factor [Deltaproteobacteria bacterium]
MQELKKSSSGQDRILEFTSRKLTNEELISGLSSGNPSAARQFHIRFSANISRWVWRIVGADEEHEDLVQQVLVNVITNIHSIKQADALDAWVRSVTIRVVKDELRRRKRRKRYLLRNAVTIEEDTAADPNSPFKQAHIQSFYGILNQMPPDDRIIFVLKHLEGYSNEQIAEYCGYSISTAKRRLERAKSRFLENAMKDYKLMSLIGGGDDVR